MADRVLTWYIHKYSLANNVEGENISTEFTLDADYIPTKVIVRQKEAQTVEPTVIDINDDGVSIFPDSTLQPTVNQGLLESKWDVFDEGLTVLEEGSVITLDVDQVSSAVAGAKLTVELYLDRVEL